MPVDMIQNLNWLVLVMVDSAIRWDVREFVPERDAETLVDTIVVRWITPDCPPLTFVVDGETGLNGNASCFAD